MQLTSTSSIRVRSNESYRHKQPRLSVFKFVIASIVMPLANFFIFCTLTAALVVLAIILAAQ